MVSNIKSLYGINDKVQITKKIFEYICDEIPHSFDINSKKIEAKASLKT